MTKKPRKVIHVVKHKMTGALVPVKIKEIGDDNIIKDYDEIKNDRKAFTLQMLMDRWDRSRQDVINLLMGYEVPAHLSHANLDTFAEGQSPIDSAIFFEEYIYGLERKANLKHHKVKSRLFGDNK